MDISEERSKGSLSARQQLAITELLGSPSIEESCRRAKVARATIYEWLKEPTFQAELKRQRKELVEQALNRLKMGLFQAANKLFALLEQEGNPGIQLRASQTLLDQGIKAIELQDLECRLEMLEQQVQEQRGRR